MKLASSDRAKKVWQLVQDLQIKFKTILESCDPDDTSSFERIEWLRDETPIKVTPTDSSNVAISQGAQGGGWRQTAIPGGIFNRASINISQVHYEDIDKKKLLSATSLSTIVHPCNPLAPSTHMHFNWTSLRNRSQSWRLMADLNPAIIDTSDQAVFNNALTHVAKEQFEYGVKQGEQYFSIPELRRNRGVSHFYLEGYQTNSFESDYDFAQKFAIHMISTYGEILHNAIASRNNYSEAQSRNQIEYHTLYLFQVLTLDRGTTAGLLAHAQNDLGIMGSLPARIDRSLLETWLGRISAQKKPLLVGIIEAIHPEGIIDDPAKLRLAQVLRLFYDENPSVLSSQARGFSTPNSQNSHA